MGISHFLVQQGLFSFLSFGFSIFSNVLQANFRQLKITEEMNSFARLTLVKGPFSPPRPSLFDRGWDGGGLMT